MRLQFLGCGDAFGSGGRFNTCFLVSGAASRFLIDCGATSLVAMRRFGIDPNGIDTVFVSHLHGDHFGGLPFLILDARFASRRTAPLTVAGPPGLKQRLADAMEALFPGMDTPPRKFDLVLRELEPETEAEVNGIAVTPATVVHASGAPSFALRLAAEGKVMAYSGDTEWTDALLRMADGADLFVTECYAFDAPVKFHLDYATLSARLPQLRAKRVILTHLGPAMLANRERVGIETAEDGKAVEF